MPTDTNLEQLVINELTKAQYDALTPVVNQLYLTPDTTDQDIAAAVSTHNSSIAAHAGLFAGKQDQLVSGTNIKTINGNSILTSGNINASEVSVASTGTSTTEVQYITINNTEYKLAGGGSVVALTTQEVDTIWENN